MKMPTFIHTRIILCINLLHFTAKIYTGKPPAVTSTVIHTPRKRKEKKLRKQQKKLLTSIKEKGPLGKKTPFTRKEKSRSVMIRRVVSRQASKPHLISLKVRRKLERTSGLHKLKSIVRRMSMKLESDFLDSLPIKTETLQRNQIVRNASKTPLLERMT